MSKYDYNSYLKDTLNLIEKKVVYGDIIEVSNDDLVEIYEFPIDLGGRVENIFNHKLRCEDLVKIKCTKDNVVVECDMVKGFNSDNNDTGLENIVHYSFKTKYSVEDFDDVKFLRRVVTSRVKSEDVCNKEEQILFDDKLVDANVSYAIVSNNYSLKDGVKNIKFINDKNLSLDDTDDYYDFNKMKNKNKVYSIVGEFQ